MPRPKGSKNKKPSVRATKIAPMTVEQIADEKAAIAKEIEEATAAVNEAAQFLKDKKAALKAAQKKLAKFEKQEAALTAQAEQEQRKADAERLAAAFLASGKSLDEVLNMLK